MKRMFLVMVVLLAAYFVPTHAATASGAQTPAQPVGPIAEFLVPATPQPVPAVLPSCGGYDGTSCTTPGDRFRCEWIPGEPGRCVCSSSFIWNCG